MKKMALIVSLIICTYIVNAQKVLINNGGVSLSYSSEYTNTLTCGDNYFDQYKITAYLNNNSGHTINIGYCNVSYTYYRNQLDVSPCTHPFPSTATINIHNSWANNSTDQSSIYVLVPSGKGLPEPDFDMANITVVDANVELPKPNPTVPKPNSSNNNQTSNPPKNNKPVIKLDQDDLRVNPVDPKIKEYELQRQQEQEARDKQTQQNLINAEKQRQIEAKKQLDLDNKRKTDEYDRQQEAIKQQQILREQQQAAAQAEYDRFMADQQQRYEQNQQDFSNAQSASDAAYQSAVSSGKKTSGAMLDATLAGASQISDPTTALGYTGVGLAFSLIAYAGEKKQERLDAAVAARREEEEIKREEQRKLMIIDAKDKFVDDALTINQYAFSDLISKERYAALLIVPDDFNPDKQAVYFSIPVKVQQYSDSTYPLKDRIEKELLLCIDKSLIQGKNIYTLYPIVNIDKFENDFTKKMGSSHLIYLDAAMIKFKKVPFYEINESDAAGTDFWGNPVSNKKVEPSPQKTTVVKKEDFWNK